MIIICKAMVLTNQFNKLSIPDQKRISSEYSKGKFIKGLFNGIGTAVLIDHQQIFGRWSSSINTGWLVDLRGGFEMLLCISSTFLAQPTLFLEHLSVCESCQGLVGGSMTSAGSMNESGCAGGWTGWCCCGMTLPPVTRAACRQENSGRDGVRR